MSGMTMPDALTDLLPEPLLLLSLKGEILQCNAAARRCLEIAEGHSLGDALPGEAAKLQASLRLWARSGDYIRGLVTLKGTGGRDYATYGARVVPGNGASPGILVRCQVSHEANQRFIEITRRVNALNREVTRRKQIETQLFAEKELAQVTLQSIGDAVITTDTAGNVAYLNPVAEKLTGWPENEARGRPLNEVFRIFNERTGKPVTSPVDRVLADGHVVGLANHTVLLHRDGREFSIDDSAAPIRDRSGRLIGVVMVFHDVSHERSLAAKLSYQASHDGLTGLLNRQSFEHRLSNLLEAPGAMDSPHSLMFLDLDQFKVINDSCGHLAGDALLRALGPLLQRHLRHSDLLARLGGDEFGVLLQDCPPATARSIAQAMQESLEDFTFVWEGKPFNVGVSIGQVNFSDGSWNLGDLMSAADNACYVAKEQGRGRIHLYSRDDRELADRFRQAQWVGRIREAFQENRFRLYAQLIAPLNAADQGGAHFELLLRLHDADGKLVPPMAFIPAAERYNLMVSIDQWVIESAFAALARSSGARIDTCTINLSGASLGDDRFLDFVQDCFTRFAVAPEIVCFEITETVAIANLANARRIMDVLKAVGCRFSLDDFGSGMSSFGYLKNLPVDYLKIDGAFVKDMADDPIDCAMVTAIHNIGHVMGLKTIAEFVEGKAILQSLRDLGVDYAQGFGIARPQPLEMLLADLAGNVQPLENDPR